ncbi:hypothetical protein MMC22_004378 [Lobaria immixta]|nr:hypothetical protein [Lobaria immixta]
MDQKPTGAQMQSVDQLPEGVKQHIEPSTTSEPLGLSDSRTPLGESMDQISASLLAEDPITWHLRYWSSLFLVGVLSGVVRSNFMAIMIQMEIIKIPDGEIATELRRVWIERQSTNEGEDKRLIELPETLSRIAFSSHEKDALKNEEVKRLLRDVDRILLDKRQKTRACLHQLESLLDTTLEAGDLETAIECHGKICDLCDGLDDEEILELDREVFELGTTDTEEIRQILSIPRPVRNQGEQRPEIIETKHADNN